MNTKDALVLLVRELESFSFHSEFINEFTKLLKKELKGKEKVFFKCLTTQLNYIKTLGKNVHIADGHEIIQGFDGHYYSIHLEQQQFNIRFLVHIDDTGVPIFLCAFYERSGHKNTSYDNYTDILLKRFREICKEDSNG